MIELGNKVTDQKPCESIIMRLISFDSEVSYERGIFNHRVLTLMKVNLWLAKVAV